MILLKDLLAEARLYSYTTKELLEKFTKFEGKTLIFLDTETTGVDPNKWFVQITQLALLAVDGSTWEVKDEFSTKINLIPTVQNLLNSPGSKEAGQYAKYDQEHTIKYKKPNTHPKELLNITQYFTQKPGDKMISEPEALKACEEFLKKHGDCIIIAHNAGFDMKVIEVRRRENGMRPMKRYPVLDTVKIARFFFIPTLVSLENNEEAKKFLELLLAKTKYKSYGTSLGKLANVFKVVSDDWHDASADTKMLFQVLQKMIEFLKQHSDLDIRKYKTTQIKRFRNTRV